jgi:hypothetical protein
MDVLQGKPLKKVLEVQNSSKLAMMKRLPTWEEDSSNCEGSQVSAKVKLQMVNNSRLLTPKQNCPETEEGKYWVDTSFTIMGTPR